MGKPMALAAAPQKGPHRRHPTHDSVPTGASVAAGATPFTLAHFRAWAADLILDDGESWHPEPFQDAFIEDVFSGKPECWLVVPQGNGKTTLVAGLALYHCEFRPMANVPVAASSRDQAIIMYQQAEGFVLRSPRMYESVQSPIQAAKGKRKIDVPRFMVLEGYRRINHFAGGRIQIMAADDRTGDGGIPTLAILDELHRHRDLALYRTWAGKLTKRGGQIVGISTAGEPGSDFENTRELIRKGATETLRRGSFIRAAGPRVVLHEWALAPGASPENLAAVKAGNPFSGKTIPALKEERGTPTMTLEHWLRYVCNRPTRAHNVAIEEAEWASARTDEQIPEGESVWLGLDVAWKYDTTAAVPFWMRDSEHRLLGPAVVLVPPRDGTMLDGALVEAAIRAIHKRNPIHTVVMDMTRAESIARWLVDELGAEVIDRAQTTPDFAQDYERFMEGIRNGWLKHTGDAALTAHALNAITKITDLQGRAYFARPSDSRYAEQERRVIDALVAAAMVHSYAAFTEADPPSVYEGERGLVAI